MTEAARIVDQPQPGYFRLKLARGAVWVAARIFRACPMCVLTGYPSDRAQPLLAEIDDEGEFDPVLGMKLVDVDRVWLWGERIPEHEFRFLKEDAAWARANSPTDPKARPRQKINAIDIPRLFA